MLYAPMVSLVTTGAKRLTCLVLHSGLEAVKQVALIKVPHILVRLMTVSRIATVRYLIMTAPGPSQSCCSVEGLPHAESQNVLF